MSRWTRRRLLMVSATQQSGRLGADYREVQWLQGTGTQYCLTDVYPVYDANNYTSIKGDFTVLDAQNSDFEIACYWTQSGAFRYGCAFSYAYASAAGAYQSTLFFYFGKTNQGNATANYSNYTYPLNMHFEINRDNVVHNGGTSNKPYVAVYSSTRPLVIGGIQGSDGTVNISNTQTRFKKFKIYNNNTLQYEFVPCYRKSDSKTGFCKIDASDGTITFFPSISSSNEEWLIGPRVR